MNRGAIPGFYYDEEKKKYFQIQPDHAVPAGAKHSRSNVKHEKAATKKRKITERFEKKRRTQTISRSRILSLPEYGGIGLYRELGGRSLAVSRIQADAAFVSQLQPVDARFPGHTLLSAHPIPTLGRTLFTSCGYQNGDVSIIFTYPWDISRSHDRRWQVTNARPQDSGDSSTWAAFRSTRVMSTSVWPYQDPEKLLICTTSGRDNVYIDNIRYDGLLQPQAPVFLTFGDDDTTLWDSAIEPTTGTDAAIATSNELIHLSMEGHALGQITNSPESRAIDWLNPTTIVAGTAKNVVLWDTRAGGAAQRFSHPGTITGLHTVLGTGGTQVLASSNHKLSLYDVRMAKKHRDRSLLSFPILHESPQLSFSISSQHLVAAATKQGAKNIVQVFSLRTGREVCTLKLPESLKDGTRIPSQLAWREDERGATFLQACIGDRIVKWCWEDYFSDVTTANEYLKNLK